MCVCVRGGDRGLIVPILFLASLTLVIIPSFEKKVTNIELQKHSIRYGMNIEVV